MVGKDADEEVWRGAYRPTMADAHSFFARPEGFRKKAEAASATAAE